MASNFDSGPGTANPPRERSSIELGDESSRYTSPRTQARLFYGILGTLVVLAFAGVALIVAVLPDDEQAPPPPSQIEVLRPGVNETALRQDSVGVKTIAGWSCELRIDGVRIPEAQLEGTSELGECLFRPGAEKIIEELNPGPHVAKVTIFETTDPERRLSYRWEFTAR